jgi:hypothetical protein
MRAGESTFMGCPLSYLHPQAIPLAPRFSGKLHRRRAGVRGGGKKQTHGWRSAAALARSKAKRHNHFAIFTGPLIGNSGKPVFSLSFQCSLLVFAHNSWASALFRQHYFVQSSTFRCLIRLNAASLDMRVSPSERAWAAIIMSMLPKSFPRRSSPARRSP